MMRKAAVLFALLLCGCHDSLGLVGDAHLDPTTEPPGDVLMDGIHDAVVDPVVDPITDPDPDAPCPPRSDEDVLVNFSFDDDRFLRYNLTLVCSTEEFLDDPAMGTLDVWFSCRSDEGSWEEHHLNIQMNPYPPIDASLFFEGEILIRYAAEASSDDPLFWVSRWLVVTNRPGGLVLIAVSAETVEPMFHEDWYNPLDVWRIGGRCPVQEEYCGSFEREAVGVSGRSGAPVEVFDGTMMELGDPGWDSYRVLVSAAHHYRYIECEDMPVDWVQALIVRLP